MTTERGGKSRPGRAAQRALLPAPGRTLTYAFHMQAWKRPFLRRYFKDRDFVFIPFFLSERQLVARYLSRIDPKAPPEFFIWSLNLPVRLQAFIQTQGIKTHYLEDGFIRSARPHAGRSPPLSLTVDSRTPYFDSRTPSDLEMLLSTHDFESDPDLIAQAEDAIALLLESRISKYNSLRQVPEVVYGPKLKRRVLVVGQVDNDASIRYGCAAPLTNEDLIRVAVSENPDAEVIYKPHPDILSGFRASRSDLLALESMCTVMKGQVSMAQAFETVDHVYTITSLAGFEALLRGLHVTVLGSPFYGGWGLTDDRQANPRRLRRLTVAELFAGAYILYPQYFEPTSGRRVTFEAAIEALRQGSQVTGGIEPDAKSRWRPFGAYGFMGWRHLLRPFVSPVVAFIGNTHDTEYYNAYPIDFFRERPRLIHRLIGRLLYPLDEKN